MWCHLEGNCFFGGGVFWEIHIKIWGVFWEIHIQIGGVGGILGNSHTYLWGGILGNSHTNCGGVFWEIHIHICGGGYSGNLNLIPE